MKEFKIDIWFLFRLTINRIINDNIFKLPYLENINGYKKQIMIEGGGGYLFYYAGICQAIFELYREEELKNIVWSGTSAGSLGGILQMIDPHVSPIKNMEECDKIILSKISKMFIGGIYNINRLTEEFFLQKTKEFHDIYKRQDNRFFICTMNINIICPILSYLSMSYNFDNEKEFMSTEIASHGLPFISGLPKHTIIPHPNAWYILRTDGCILTTIFGWFYGYQHIMPYGKQVNYSLFWTGMFRTPNLRDFWIDTRPKECWRKFKIGYNDAINNQEKLDKLIR